MAKQKPGMTPEEQSAKFRETVRDMETAGELNRTDADAAFERLLTRVKVEKDDSQSN